MDLGEEEKLCADFSTAKAQLVDAKFDYAGEPIANLEELVADQVIPVWPGIGESAVQPVVDFGCVFRSDADACCHERSGHIGPLAAKLERLRKSGTQL